MPVNRDAGPAELVARHIREWMVSSGQDSNWQACELLALRTGLDISFPDKISRGRYQGVRFDIADRLFCAIGKPDLWHSDPELQKHYERAVIEADRSAPIAAAA